MFANTLDLPLSFRRRGPDDCRLTPLIFAVNGPADCSFYLGNRRNQVYDEDYNDSDVEVDCGSYLNDEQISSLSKYVPKSILSFLTVQNVSI